MPFGQSLPQFFLTHPPTARSLTSPNLSTTWLPQRHPQHPTIHTLHTRNMMTARGTHHQDLTTETTAILPADSTHVTAPTRPTTIVTIRLHASIHPHISLTLAHLALTTLHSLRRNAVTGTIPHLRETSLIHRSLRANLPRLHHLSARRKQLHDSPQPHIRTLRRP